LLGYSKWDKKIIVLQKNHIMKLKAGVLGAGHLGKIHLKLLQQSEKYELVGFYDPDASNGQKVES
jgi:predicted dehydrogenase